MISKLLQFVFTTASYGELRTDCFDVVAKCYNGDFDVFLGSMLGRTCLAVPTHRAGGVHTNRCQFAISTRPKLRLSMPAQNSIPFAIERIKVGVQPT